MWKKGHWKAGTPLIFVYILSFSFDKCPTYLFVGKKSCETKIVLFLVTQSNN